MFDKNAYYREYRKNHLEEMRVYQREWKQRWRLANPLKNKEIKARHYRNNRAEIDAKHRKWAMNNPEKMAAARKRRRAEHGDEMNRYMRAYGVRLRNEALDAYGRICVCCNEWREELLTFDHINGDGAQERKRLRGIAIYAKMKREGYPKDKYRILCWNCNSSRGIRGYCPHERERQQKLEVVA